MTFKAACIQLNSDNQMRRNIASAEKWLRQAQREGAALVALPENAVMMAKDKEEAKAYAFSESEHPALQAFRKLAEELKLWILVGSLGIKIKDNEKYFNRSYLISDHGEIAAKYDKIHLFDVALTNGEQHKESSRIEPGKEAVVAKTPFAALGLTICYDLRFPQLFRSLAKKGAECITVPAAFTEYTGQAHWEVLLRARAIENGCYILAPAMTGTHPANRQTHGHSMIIDPWGKVLADAGKEEGVIVAEIDTDYVKEIRASLPSLTHDRDFT